MPLPSVAHHSTTAYDLSKSVTLSGTVKDFQWTNPHSWIDLEVENSDATQTHGAIEFGAPNLNARAGWKRDDVHVGDKVTMVVHPMRDGTTHGTLSSITLPDGRTLKGAAEFLTNNSEVTSGVSAPPK